MKWNGRTSGIAHQNLIDIRPHSGKRTSQDLAFRQRYEAHLVSCYIKEIQEPTGEHDVFVTEFILRDISYSLDVGPIENAYSDGRLVLLRRASLPDVCVVCGSPAWGNIYHIEFTPYRYPA